MDPDIVREQEEAERMALGLAPLQAAMGASAPVYSRHAFRPLATAMEGGLGGAPYQRPEKTAPFEHPNRRSLPPLGSGRRPGEEPPVQRRVRGLLRLFLYAIVGAAIGGATGFIGNAYFDLFKEQTEFFISAMAGGFALLFGLTHLLYYDH